MNINECQFKLIRACKSACNTDFAFPNVVKWGAKYFGMEESYIRNDLRGIVEQLLEVSVDLPMGRFIDSLAPNQLWKVGFNDTGIKLSAFSNNQKLDSGNWLKAVCYVLISHISLTEVAKYENYFDFERGLED